MTLPSAHSYAPASSADLGDVARLARHGFGQSRDLFDRYAALFGTDTIRCLRPGTGGPPLACAAVWPMEQWFGGRPLPAWAVAMVAVDPAARGTGAGSALMRAVLTEGRASGAAVCVLHPSTLPFYRRLGFGRGGVTCNWSASPTVLAAPDTPADGLVRPTDPLDAVPLAALRRTLLASANGLPERNEAMWTLALCPEGEPSEVFLLCAPDGAPEGYIALTPPRDGRLTVADLCLPTARSARLARRLLAGYRAQVQRVLWSGGPDDPLALLAEDTGVRLDGREEWLVRVLDVRRALATRGYPRTVQACINFETNDPLVLENCGRFHLEVAGGVGVIADHAQDDAPTVSLDIASLSSVFTGHAGAVTLKQAGLLHGEEKASGQLDLLFCGARPWMPDRF